MLLMFCRKNKGNKKGRVPSEGLDLNLYSVQKVLADTNKMKIVFSQYLHRWLQNWSEEIRLSLQTGAIDIKLVADPLYHAVKVETDDIAI